MLEYIINKYNTEVKTLVDILIFSGITIKNFNINDYAITSTSELSTNINNNYVITSELSTIKIYLYRNVEDSYYISISIWKNSINRDTYTCECISHGACFLHDKVISSIVFTKQSFINAERNYKINFLLK